MIVLTEDEDILNLYDVNSKPVAGSDKMPKTSISHPMQISRDAMLRSVREGGNKCKGNGNDLYVCFGKDEPFFAGHSEIH